jgi:hypothetical protein
VKTTIIAITLTIATIYSTIYNILGEERRGEEGRGKKE